MKFGTAKLPKTFYKNTKKKFKRKKKKISSFGDGNVTTNFCNSGRKSYVIWLVQCRCYWEPGRPYPPSWFTKICFLEHHVRPRKPTMMQKVIITFNPICLIKVTFIGSIIDERTLRKTVIGWKCYNGNFQKISGLVAKYFACNTPAYAYPLFKTHKILATALENISIYDIPVRLLQSAGYICTS